MIKEALKLLKTIGIPKSEIDMDALCLSLSYVDDPSDACLIYINYHNALIEIEDIYPIVVGDKVIIEYEYVGVAKSITGNIVSLNNAGYIIKEDDATISLIDETTIVKITKLQHCHKTRQSLIELFQSLEKAHASNGSIGTG